jgi:hypothetical protein
LQPGEEALSLGGRGFQSLCEDRSWHVIAFECGGLFTPSFEGPPLFRRARPLKATIPRHQKNLPTVEFLHSILLKRRDGSLRQPMLE